MSQTSSCSINHTEIVNILNCVLQKTLESENRNGKRILPLEVSVDGPVCINTDFRIIFYCINDGLLTVHLQFSQAIDETVIKVQKSLFKNDPLQGKPCERLYQAFNEALNNIPQYTSGYCSA